MAVYTVSGVYRPWGMVKVYVDDRDGHELMQFKVEAPEGVKASGIEFAAMVALWMGRIREDIGEVRTRFGSFPASMDNPTAVFVVVCALIEGANVEGPAPYVKDTSPTGAKV